MTSRMKIFDHFCKPLAEIKIGTRNRNWILNDYGRAEFSIGFASKTAQSAQTLKEEWFQFGNLVHIMHNPTSGGGTLPTWTGIILPPRIWDFGACRMTAYSAEAILQFRAMKYADVKGTPKTILTNILENVNSRSHNIKFLQGKLDDIPASFSDRLVTNAYDHIKKLGQNSGMDWDVSGEVNAKGELDLYVNLYARKGMDVEIALQSGDGGNVKLDSPLLKEQGTPYNQIFGYSEAQSDNSRVGPIEAIDQEAYDDYGALQLNQVLVGKRDQTSVENSVKTLSEERSRPVKVVKRTALDNGDLFSFLEVGNKVKIKETNAGFNSNGYYGFEAKARILSMDYNDIANNVPLTIEVIDD